MQTLAQDNRQDMDLSDPDRRFRLTKLPETVMHSLRWLGRPPQADGNPSHTYQIESPSGDFFVMIGHHKNGDVHPFEVYVNGSKCLRGLGAIAKTLSGDMRTFDRRWLALKLDAMMKSEGDPFNLAMPPDGEMVMVPGLVAAFGKVVKYHATKVGWFDNDGDGSLVNAMMFRKEPKTGTNGTLSWTVDIRNASAGDKMVMFVKELELPDGSRRPYSLWLSGNYPKTFDGVCKLLSVDMRIADISWIGMKLRKLLNYSEPLGDFIAFVPGSSEQQRWPSTIAYMARLLIHRYAQLGLLNKDGTAKPAKAVE